MTSTEFERIKRKIEEGKLAKARAEGNLEQIKTTLKEVYGVDTISAAKAKLEELESAQAILLKEKEELEKQLLALTDWDAL